MTTDQLRQTFIEAGRSGKSINSCLHGLKKNGEINNGPEGYTLSKKTKDKLRHRKSKTG